MTIKSAAIALGALLAVPSFAADAKPLPPYFASLLSHYDTVIEACHLSILARNDIRSRQCRTVQWLIRTAQLKAKVKDDFDFKDEARFKAMVAELTLARNEKQPDQQPAPLSQEVSDNIVSVVAAARDKLENDEVIQCLAEIRYRNDPSSPYCDYTLALLNLVLFRTADAPRIKMQREDMAAVLEQALSAK